MVRLTRVVGIVLMVLGVVYFVMTGSVHRTSLIPSGFGLVLFVCGVLAATENDKRRALWMHIAVTIGLIGFLFPGFRAGKALAGSTALTAGQHTAAQESLIMAAICAVFTALCVRTFIANRSARTAEAI